MGSHGQPLNKKKLQIAVMHGRSTDSVGELPVPLQHHALEKGSSLKGKTVPRSETKIASCKKHAKRLSEAVLEEA